MWSEFQFNSHADHGLFDVLSGVPGNHKLDLIMKAWIKLIAFVVLIWCFVKYTPVLLNKVKIYKQVIDYSMKMGIDNAALFYTEEPLTSQAEQELIIKLRSKE